MPLPPASALEVHLPPDQVGRCRRGADVRVEEEIRVMDSLAADSHRPEECLSRLLLGESGRSELELSK